MSGWIKLHRKLQSNPIWLSEPFTRGQAWVDLILLANHSKGFLRARGVRVDVERGQVGMSHVKLSERWTWSRGKVKRFLNELETDQQIVQQNNNITCLISIVNYNEYQGNDTADNTPSDTADGQQTVQQTGSKRYTNKKEKNLKNEKNEEELMAFDYFRRGYKNAGGNVRGNETEFKDFTKKHKDWRVVLPDLDSLLKCIINERVVKKRAGLFVPDWKHLKTWLYNRCWEEEQTKEVKKEWRPS